MPICFNFARQFVYLCMFAGFLMIEGYGKCVLQKELIIGHGLKQLKHNQ